MRPNANGALELVLGVMTSPSARLNRDNLRALSHAEPDIAQRAHLAFVLGDLHCTRNTTVGEAAKHGDIVYIAAPDCTSWYRAQKFHVWFKFAVRRWPHVPWIGKVEDDAVYRVSSVLRDLSALDHHEPWYYGILAFGGSCSFQEECPGGASAAGCCGGCFAKALSPYPQQAARCSSGATCPKPHCAVDYDGSRAHHGSAQCPEVVIAPFAIGPIEVRSRPLARQIADCSQSDRYFSALTQRGDALRGDCAAGDAVQAQALTMCAPSVRLADATWRRMSYTGSAMSKGYQDYVRRQGNTTLAWTHPAKSFHPARARELWHAFTDLPYAAQPLHTYRLETAAPSSGGGGPVTLTAAASIQPF